MTKQEFNLSRLLPVQLRQISLLLVLSLVAVQAPVLAQTSTETSTATTTSTTNVTGNVTGNGNGSFSNTGVGINGDTSGANVNNNQNSLSTGSNQNQNTIYSPTNNNSLGLAQGGQSIGLNQGGNAVLVLPRNPLNLPNAALGRSNFGLQFGVNNQQALTPTGGIGNALGWFLQGGVTIPFGKIPDMVANPRNNRMDEVRQQRADDARNVFGNVAPKQPNAQTDVSGKVVGLSAYNYATIPSSKIHNETLEEMSLMAKPVSPNRPKVIALEIGGVYTQPLTKGDKVGSLEVGKEYNYLGHTRSGWVKVLLPNGVQGWAKSKFEYIKFDYTEIDNLTAGNYDDNNRQESSKAMSVSHHK